MTKLYIEPFSGLSGDMLLGALAALTDGYDTIKGLPEALNLPDGRVDIEEVNKNGIACKHVKVVDLGSNSGEDHEHTHGHSHSHHHRHLSDIQKLIGDSQISGSAKQIAQDIFLIIGQAESHIHNISLEKIHFHEVSGVDSIIDIVGCAVLIDQLKISKTYSEPVCTGYGMVKTQHGLLPVPAPATAEILHGIPNYKGDEEGERVTPTGAAILKYLEPEFNPPQLISTKTGYGPGQKEFKQPNVLRLSIVEPMEKSADDTMVVIESNIDDSTGEYLGEDFQQQLLEAGATDFYFTPVQMKKGRPGLKITILSAPSKLQAVQDFVLENTSTIGLRYYSVGKARLAREELEIQTPYGPIKVKEVIKPSGAKRRKIEYESLKAISKKNNINIQELQKELYNLISS